MINIQVLKVMFNKMDSCIKMNRGGINLFYRIRYGMGIVWNYLRYKATISDYFELRFFETNSKEKKMCIRDRYTGNGDRLSGSPKGE